MRASPPTQKVHGGLFIGAGPVLGVAVLEDEEFLCQSVAVQPGCCYTLTGAYETTGGGADAFGVANVAFFATRPELCTPPLTDPISIAPDLPPTGNHFLIPGPVTGSVQGFQTFTFVACAPDTANFACICFKNKGLTEMKIDSVQFFATGGPCTSCTGNP